MIQPAVSVAAATFSQPHFSATDGKPGVRPAFSGFNVDRDTAPAYTSYFAKKQRMVPPFVMGNSRFESMELDAVRLQVIALLLTVLLKDNGSSRSASPNRAGIGQEPMSTFRTPADMFSRTNPASARRGPSATPGHNAPHPSRNANRSGYAGQSAPSSTSGRSSTRPSANAGSARTERPRASASDSTNESSRANEKPTHASAADAHLKPKGWSFDKLPHEILGVSAGETDLGKIKRAYHKQAMQHHPDKVGKSGEEAFKAANAANEFLRGAAQAGAAPAPAA